MVRCLEQYRLQRLWGIADSSNRDKRQGPIWILPLMRRKLHSAVGAVIIGLVDAIGEILGRACAFRRVQQIGRRKRVTILFSIVIAIYHPVSWNARDSSQHRRVEIPSIKREIIAMKLFDQFSWRVKSVNLLNDSGEYKKIFNLSQHENYNIS